jgi:PadR family transcriptional regulator PadR
MLNLEEKNRIALLQGTLDLLILRILVFGPQHGQGIARAIQSNSEDVLLVDHGALYPALQRLEAQKWIRNEWGVSSNNRQARFYTLTSKGRKHMIQETGRWPSYHHGSHSRPRKTQTCGGIKDVSPPKAI